MDASVQEIKNICVDGRRRTLFVEKHCEVHSEEVVPSHNSVLASKQKPKANAGAGGDSGLANGPSVFNRLYNGLVFTVHLLDLMFYGFILIVSPVKLGEQRPRKSHGRPDVCLLYFLSMEIQVPAIRLINQSGRFGASGSSCSWPCECCSISNVSTVSAAQTDVKC